VCEITRDIAFCAHAILTDEVLIVPDARLDARFVDNPLVTGDTRLRFNAGAPLRTPSGANVGTLSIIDTVPRTLSEAEIATLSDLAALGRGRNGVAMAAARCAMKPTTSANRHRSRCNAAKSFFRSLIENSSDIVAVMDKDGVMRYQSPSTQRLLGYQPAS
jgi:PAS domain-containing protein